MGEAVAAEPGKPDPATAAATLRSIEEAVRLARAGEAAGLVTNPIAKHVLYAGRLFAIPGHTEFLAALSVEPGRTPPHPVMMLWCEALAVVPVTIHIPLRASPRGPDAGADRQDGADRRRATCAGASASRGRASRSPGSTRTPARAARSATRRRRSSRPRSRRCAREGIAASGPYPADTMFHAAARAPATTPRSPCITTRR